MRRLKTAHAMGHAGAATGALSMAGPPRRRAMPAQRVPVRRRPRSALERHAIRAAAIGAGILALVGLLYWFVASGWSSYLSAVAERSLLKATADVGYRIETLDVEGRGETGKQAILIALGALKGDPIFALDLNAARQRLLELPWVTDAVVERRLPDKVHVVLTEAEPLALWQRRGVFHLVSRHGQVVAVSDVGRFAHLPVIVGEGAPLAAGELFALLATEPDLKDRVTAAVLVGERRWNLRLDNGVDVKLPELDAVAAWSRFAALERQHHLLAKDVTVIDLRQPDKLILRQPPPAESATQDEPAAQPAAAPGAARPGGSNET
ncbi:cell division protein FtsQ [Dongia mobilis]|uniref:Cell division protein FtsQ n=1 Tax=Dongia mobilis TaxID=578943 RepID=A0A4R6X0J5_9PROT|nr:cell division protein FtsQ/DivIB [Dongia mobilis]TDQ83968.1 cell division protein FtsQ [Dongia mobilis]